MPRRGRKPKQKPEVLEDVQEVVGEPQVRSFPTEEAAEAATEPVEWPTGTVVPIALTKDGDQWCALVGDNLQDGVGAFGDTPWLALEALVPASDSIDLMGFAQAPPEASGIPCPQASLDAQHCTVLDCHVSQAAERAKELGAPAAPWPPVDGYLFTGEVQKPAHTGDASGEELMLKVKLTGSDLSSDFTKLKAFGGTRAFVCVFEHMHGARANGQLQLATAAAAEPEAATEPEPIPAGPMRLFCTECGEEGAGEAGEVCARPVEHGTEDGTEVCEGILGPLACEKCGAPAPPEAFPGYRHCEAEGEDAGGFFRVLVQPEGETTEADAETLADEIGRERAEAHNDEVARRGRD